MSYIIPTTKRVTNPNASWMNNRNSLSIEMWVKLQTITGVDKQYVFSHRGAANQFSLRKDSSTNKWRASVTCGGVSQFLDSTAAATANTLYHLVVTWRKQNSTGIALYIDGVLNGSKDTTDQIVAYDSGSETDPIIFGWRSVTSDINNGGLVIEGVKVYHSFLNANQVKTLYYEGWPLNQAIQPAAFWLFEGKNLTRVPDRSGNGHHIVQADIDPTVTDGGRIGKWGREKRVASRAKIAEVAAPAGPGPWIPWVPDSTNQSALITGLTPGTQYQIAVSAIDKSLNESAMSAPVSVVAGQVVVKHVARRRLLG